MRTIEVKVPDEILGFLGSLSREREDFILKAIKEKINRDKKQDLRTLLAEGYQATFAEDSNITQEFEAADPDNL